MLQCAVQQCPNLMFISYATPRYGLPTSSSQCITGAIMGVGLMEGAKGVNWIVFLRQFISWVCTLGLVMGLTAALFAQVRTTSLPPQSISCRSAANTAPFACWCCQHGGRRVEGQPPLRAGIASMAGPAAMHRRLGI